MVCDETGSEINGYENCYDERICEELYDTLPHKPQELIDLKDERIKCIKAEAGAGILHFMFCSINKVNVPKLKIRIPKP